MILSEKVVQVAGNEEYSMTQDISLLDELTKHRDLALERARLEADFENKQRALKKIKETLSKIPDIDVDKVQYNTRSIISFMLLL